MKILVVDDSALVRSILTQVLEPVHDIKIIGEAANGKDAITKTIETKPDLVIMDINMPIMDGIESTRIIMENNPVPILIFSNALDAISSFKAMHNGAVDVMSKPDLVQFNNPEFLNAFIEKLHHISDANIMRHHAKRKRFSIDKLRHEFELLVMGASTGGPSAVKTIISKLPGDFPLCIALVQHLETGFDEGFAEWLNDSSNLKVKLCSGKENITPGTVVVAPVDKHLKVKENNLVLDDGPKVMNHKPSVNVLFRSAANRFGKKVLGVLLTGMGSDGADGCEQIISKGGFTIVQDEKSSAIYGMPKTAIDRDAASTVMSLDEIPGYLSRLMEVEPQKNEPAKK